VIGEYEVLFFSPMQTPQPIPILDFRFNAGKLSFKVPSVSGTFSADFVEDKIINGTWSQGISLKLDLKKTMERPFPRK